MCSCLHKAPNGVYYFRMSIRADLRPFMAGKREIEQLPVSTSTSSPRGWQSLDAQKAAIAAC